MIIQGVSYLSDFEAKKAMTAIAAKLYAKGWMTAGDGSISVRVGPNAVWMTLEGADKSALTMDKLIRIDLNGRQSATNKPKALGEDVEAHLRIYRENEQVRSIVHAYPVCSVVLSKSGHGIEAADFTPSVRKLGRIRLVGPLNKEQSISDIALLCKNDSGVIIRNDGCMMWGRDPFEAADRIESFDYCCKALKCLAGGCGATALNAVANAGSALGLGISYARTHGSTVNASQAAALSGSAAETAGNAASPQGTDPAEQTIGDTASNAYEFNAAAASGAFFHGDRSMAIGAGVSLSSEGGGNCRDCGGDCASCTESACDRRRTEAEYHSESLPKGMTGLIRPGDPLPQIPDEEQQTAVPAGQATGSTAAIQQQAAAPASQAAFAETSAVKSKVMSEVVRHLISR